MHKHFVAILFTFLLSVSAYSQCQNIQNDGLGQSEAYCIENFKQDISEESIQHSNEIHAVLKKLPAHVLSNLSFKRGNNLQAKSYVATRDNGRRINLKTHFKKGPFGHHATPVSTSATPWEPRAFVWDEQTGFTASWNGGNPKATTINDNGQSEEINIGSHDRVDLYEFDFKTMEHKMWFWKPHSGTTEDLILASRTATQKKHKDDTCFACHGSSLRPIWPMYPDWPQFYGVYNDEIEVSEYHAGSRKDAITENMHLPLARAFQSSDKRLYEQFRRSNGSKSDRYNFLFNQNKLAGNKWSIADSWINKWQNNLFNLYPYRFNNTVTNSSGSYNVSSRGFAFRPNLRAGVLYNRFVALEIAEKIKKHPLYKKYSKVFLHSLIDCNWSNYGYDIDDSANLNSARSTIHYLSTKVGALSELKKDAEKLGTSINLSGFKNFFGDIKSNSYTQVPYEELLKAFNIEIRDVDIRFKHNASKMNGVSVYSKESMYNTQSIMDIGYLKSGARQYPGYIYSHKNFGYSNGRGNITYNKSYFNSYFDGSATTNELIAAILIKDLIENDPNTRLTHRLRTVSQNLETLEHKYRNFSNRIYYDRRFFKRVDRLSAWLPTPYPSALLSYHNRDVFGTDRGKGRGHYLNYVRTCNSLINDIAPDGVSFYKIGAEILSN